MGKRREMRERRERQRRLRAVALIAAVGVAALALAFAVIYPSIKPLGEIVRITPFPYPDAHGRVLGDPQAPVLIELYEDFQCPACGAFTRAVEPILVQNYVATGKARLAFRQFPFIGEESYRASDASMCADAQGRFWDYHAMLFANQSGENRGAFSDRRLTAFAESIGLDMQAFRACFDAQSYREEILAERRAGEAIGIRATPTIVVNGRIVEGASPNLIPSYELIAAAIETALAEQHTP